MRQRLMMSALVALTFASTAAPTFAQSFSIGPDGVRILEERNNGRELDRRDLRDRRDRREITEREAVRIARTEGLREVEDVMRMRRAYRIDGLDRRGDDIRVVIDRRSGQVLSVE